MERIKLNLIPSGVAPTVHLSQYDDGRQFAIDLFEGDSVYVLDGTETLTVDSRKPDGHIVTLTVTNTGTSSVVVDTVEQLTAVHGQSYAKLKIEKGSVTIATLEFLIAVSRDPSENGDPSDSFIQNLETQVNGFVATAVADQYDSANVIFDNVPTAGHGNGYAVTSEGVETALSGKANNSDIPVNSDFSLAGLSDTTITTPSSGQVLGYDGGKWKNIEPIAITPSYIHPSITNDNLLMFHKIGKTLIISGVFRGSDVPRYQTLYTLPNVKAVDSFIPFVQYGGGVGYLAVSKSGNNTNIMIANSSLTAFDNYNATNGTIIIE